MQARTVQCLSLAFFVGLLLWGVYTLLVYLGIPIHGAVLITPAAEESVKAMCGEPAATISSYLCRGTVALVPFISHTLARMGPFLWYFILSVLAYGGYLLWQYLRNGDWTLRLHWKPWKVFGIFLLLLWLLFTTLSFGMDQGRPIRFYPEPTPESYNVSEEGMQALKADFQSLQNRRCLSPMGQTQNGTNLFMLRASCVQVSFFTRVVPQIFVVLGFLFVLLVLGRLLLSLLKLRVEQPLREVILSIATGVCGLIMLLWLAAVLGVYTATVGWVLIVAVLAVGYKHALYWLKMFIGHEWVENRDWYSILTVVQWLLISLLILNFLTVVRPFPIGWDDLGSYLNRPRLLVSYGHFIFSMTPFEWGYLTSLGYLLFGYESTFGTTAAMMINWTAGLLALTSIYVVARTFLGGRAGALSALLYYSLPLVGHFSFADMKIDNAVFFMGAMATLTLFIALFPQHDAPEAEADVPPVPDVPPPTPAVSRWQYFVLAGLFCGFTFAFKATGVMVVAALGAILLGVTLHWSAFIGTVLLTGMVFSGNADNVILRVTSADPKTIIPTLSMVFLISGLASFAYALYRRRVSLMPSLKSIGIFAIGFFIAVFPWFEYGNILNGNIIPRLAFSAPNTLSPNIAIHGPESVQDIGQDIRVLPPELKINSKDPACTPTGSKEELDRYWGSAAGWGHYLTLFWRSVMNINSVGYYVTTIPALLLFPLILILPYTWSRRGRWLRWLSFGTAFMLIEWMFLANGIPWYGIGIFLGLTVALEAMVVKAPDFMGRIVASVLIALSILSAFAMRLWQFEQQRSILEYSYGKVSAEVLEELTIPHYNDITKVVLQRNAEYKGQDRPYLYRVGTFIPYFIPKNLEMIGINDHQLDVFNCLHQERDAQLTLKRLQALGFHSIIFDTNTSTIEQDPNGSLHKKVNLFQDFVNTASGAQVILNDPGAGVAFITLP